LMGALIDQNADHKIGFWIFNEFLRSLYLDPF
jgi:hypothetical protein